MTGGGKSRRGGGKKKKGSGSKNVGSKAGSSSRANESCGGSGRYPDKIGIADGMVEVVFVEDPMRLFSFCSPDEKITQAWLENVLEEAFKYWSDHLPGVQMEDLVVRAVPQLPRVGSKTFLEWSGFVVVELKESKKQLGLIEQVRDSRRNQLIAMDEKQSAEQSMATMMENIDNKISKANLELRNEVALLKTLAERSSSTLDQSNDKILRLEERVASLEGKQSDLMLQLDKEMKFNNTVRRVPLSMARDKIIKELGKGPRDEGKTWKGYFKEFSFQDWNAIFDDTVGQVLKEKVKNLLMVGSIVANREIHTCDAREAFQSISSETDIDFQNDREARVWIFEYAYGVSWADVSEEAFFCDI